MSLTRESLIEEALENARKDRKTIEKVRDQLMTVISDPSVQAEGLSVMGVAENVGYLAEVLTKMNSQLVDIIKISEASTSKDQMQVDKESIFEEIEAGTHN